MENIKQGAERVLADGFKRLSGEDIQDAFEKLINQGGQREVKALELAKMDKSANNEVIKLATKSVMNGISGNRYGVLETSNLLRYLSLSGISATRDRGAVTLKQNGKKYEIKAFTDFGNTFYNFDSIRQKENTYKLEIKGLNKARTEHIEKFLEASAIPSTRTAE